MVQKIRNTIELKRFNNELEAELLIENLKSHGVFAFIQKDDPAAMGIVRGARVFVRESDIEEAMKILKALGD